MTRRRLLAALALLSALVAAGPAGAVVPTTSGSWGCVALDGVGGLCVSNPLTSLGL